MGPGHVYSYLDSTRLLVEGNIKADDLKRDDKHPLLKHIGTVESHTEAEMPRIIFLHFASLRGRISHSFNNLNA